MTSRSEDGGGDYFCPLCGQKFTQRTGMVEHLQDLHSEHLVVKMLGEDLKQGASKASSDSGSLTGSSTTQGKSPGLPRLQVKPSPPAPQPAGAFVCEYCQKSFTRQSVLTMHVGMAHGNKGAPKPHQQRQLSVHQSLPRPPLKRPQNSLNDEQEEEEVDYGELEVLDEEEEGDSFHSQLKGVAATNQGQAGNQTFFRKSPSKLPPPSSSALPKMEASSLTLSLQTILKQKQQQRLEQQQQEAVCKPPTAASSTHLSAGFRGPPKQGQGTYRPSKAAPKVSAARFPHHRLLPPAAGRQRPALDIRGDLFRAKRSKHWARVGGGSSSDDDDEGRVVNVIKKRSGNHDRDDREWKTSINMKKVSVGADGGILLRASNRLRTMRSKSDEEEQKQTSEENSTNTTNTSDNEREEEAADDAEEDKKEQEEKEEEEADIKKEPPTPREPQELVEPCIIDGCERKFYSYFSMMRHVAFTHRPEKTMSLMKLIPVTPSTCTADAAKGEEVVASANPVEDVTPKALET